MVSKAPLRDAAARLTAARTTLVLEQPFFGMLAWALPWEPSDHLATAGTNGSRVLYSPAFVAGLSQAELVGLMVHELLHCANGHMWRRDQRDARRWNVAADLAINPIIRDAGLMLPKDGLVTPPEMRGQSAEWIYDRLPATRTMAVDTGPSAGGCDVLDAPAGGDGSAGDAPATEADWALRVRQAATAAKAAGHLPLHCERWCETVLRPLVDWRSVLRQFVQVLAREDYVWSRPNRRTVPTGLYLPSLHSEATGPIAVVVDTSGSIDGPILNQFASELRAIAEDAHPARIHVLYADAAVQGIEVFDDGDPITLTARGGGGTNFRPALDAIEAFEEPVGCIVYLTDLQGSHRRRAPEVPLLWVTPTHGARAPYGEVVTMGTER